MGTTAIILMLIPVFVLIALLLARMAAPSSISEREESDRDQAAYLAGESSHDAIMARQIERLNRK